MAKKSYSYKKTTATNMKVSGILNVEDLSVDDTEGVIYDLSSLLKDFDGKPISLSIGVRTEEDLSENE